MSLEAAFEIGQQTLQIKRIADVITGAKDKIFLELPGTLAWFPGGPTHDSGKMTNIVMDNNSLIEVGSCPIGFDGHAYRHTGDGTNYLSASVFDLTGTETYIDAAIRGFTIGAWFYFDTTPGAGWGLISKAAPVPNWGYTMYQNSSRNIILSITSNGSAGTNVTHPGQPSVGDWHFIVGRFIPSTELAIFVDGVKTTKTIAIPSGCFASTQNFEMGRDLANNSRILHGRCRDGFICASALTDDLIALIRATSM